MTRWDTKAPSEGDQQAAVVDFCRSSGVLVYHVPNGGYRSITEAVRLKDQGVMPGVPDLCIPMARGGYHGLYIEMKKDTKSKPTQLQKAWIKRLNEQGYLALVCYGKDDAILAIRKYFKGKETA